ncbi:MAG: hypothetical protein M1820_005050 [Bogoriella megaspora]|nr:MAG: hypothetical protein M1820_005050 [Bogoriella megaspora]
MSRNLPPFGSIPTLPKEKPYDFITVVENRNWLIITASLSETQGTYVATDEYSLMDTGFLIVRGEEQLKVESRHSSGNLIHCQDGFNDSTDRYIAATIPNHEKRLYLRSVCVGAMTEPRGLTLRQ